MTDCLKRRLPAAFLCVCMLILLIGALGGSAIAQEAVTPQVSVGNGFVVALNASGEAFAWGSNFKGMLGNGSFESSTTPQKVSMPEGVRFASIAAGWNHVIALSTDGRIYTWGSNAYGQLGSDATDAVTMPKEMKYSISKPVVAVAAGNSFSLALTADGEVYAWGLNSLGQLGVPNDSLKETRIPQKIEALSGVTATSIHAGNATGGIIAADGKVWIWGDNTCCQCGSAEKSVMMPVQKSGSYFAVDLALGDVHSSLVELNGSVKSFGSNPYGQFGNGSEPSDQLNIKMNSAILPQGVVAERLSAGEGYCVMVSSTGEIYSFGDNGRGQLGCASSESFSSTPQKVSISMGDASVISMDARASTSAVVDSNGLIWTWGANDQGQLGNGTFVDSAIPVGVLDGDGERLCLGSSSYTSVYQSSVTASATVPMPTYSIEIPSGIVVEELKQTDKRADGSHILFTELEIAADGVNYLFGEKYILVTVTTENGAFELADGDYRLPYAIYGSLSEEPLKPGDPFAVFTGNQSAIGRIAFDQSLITRDGSYSGRLIFEVTLNDVASE